VVVVDVPVDLEHLLARAQFAAAGDGAAEVDAVLALGDVLDLGDLALGDADGGAQALADVAEVRRCAARAGFFAQGVEEQLVLDERTAGPQAFGGFGELRRVGVLAAGGVQALADSWSSR
jgi:hypothetical protein